jgi:hypothetical protein
MGQRDKWRVKYWSTSIREGGGERGGLPPFDFRTNKSTVGSRACSLCGTVSLKIEVDL